MLSWFGLVWIQRPSVRSAVVTGMHHHTHLYIEILNGMKKVLTCIKLDWKARHGIDRRHLYIGLLRVKRRSIYTMFLTKKLQLSPTCHFFLLEYQYTMCVQCP